MKVLITGTGFLGSSLLATLIKETRDDIFTLSRSNYNYYQHITCDLLDIEKVKQTIQDIQPDIIYHTAGNAINKPDANNPSLVLRQNIEATNNLLFSLQKKTRFVFISSVTLYGIFHKTYPPNWTIRPHPLSLYSTSKLACENLVSVYTHQEKIDGVSIRIPALVGINATHGLLKDLISKTLSDSEKLNLIGKYPGSIKPYQHVDEISKIIYNIGTRQFGYEDVGLLTVVGNKDSLSVDQVAKLVMRELRKTKEIEWSNDFWVGDNPEIYIDPCYMPKSNSTDSIIKVLKEYKLANSR